MTKESYILRYVRTDYAKKIRKDYESGKIKERRCNMRKFEPRTDGVANTLSTVNKDNYLLEITTMGDEIKLPGAYGRSFGSRGKLQELDGICDTLVAAMGSGGGNVPIITEETHNMNEPFIVASRGRNPENPSDRTPGIKLEQRLEPNTDGICNTLTTVQKDNYVAEPQTTLRIRKLTPKECFRLMGFDDDAFYKAEAVNSNTQLYKQAGNSIVVDVLEHLFLSLKASLPSVLT